MVVKALQWLLCTYLVLKFLQYFFVGRSGFRATEPSFRDKLMRGEPLLFIVACAISVPTALWTSWYFQRGYEGGLARAADCYGKLSALNELDDVAHEFDALRVYRQVKAAAGATAMAARELERAPGYATRFWPPRRASIPSGMPACPGAATVAKFRPRRERSRAA